VAALDAERARRETPGCAHVHHLNNAGAALPPERVLRAQVEHLELEARIGGYEAARQAAEAEERAYEATAALLGARADEIALVENATRAWDMAFYGLPLGPGDRILTTEVEYASNYLAFLQVARRTGAVVEVLPSVPSGEVDLGALEAALERPAALVAVTHVPTSSGLVNPAAEIGALTRAAGVPYLLDACQSVGQLPLDVEAVGCDLLAGTSRKYLRGPRGVGFLYVAARMLERLDPPLVDLRAAEWTAREEYVLRPDARRFETWEANHAARIAFGVAVDYALELGLEATWARVQEVATSLRARLSATPGVTLADHGSRPCGIVTFRLDGVPAARVRDQLAARRVNVQAIPRSHSRLDMEARGLDEVVRASVHYYNDEGDLDALCAGLEEIAPASGQTRTG
jgi:cysteine desulfurase/selenocysteine lyase